MLGLMLESTHSLMMEIEQMKLSRMRDDVVEAQAQRKKYADLLDAEIHRGFEQSLTNEKLVKINEALTAELLILRSAVSIRTDRDKPAVDQYAQPDVTVFSEEADLRLRDLDAAEMKALRGDLEAKLAALAGEIGEDKIASVTPEQVLAATPATPEDWAEEHKP